MRRVFALSTILFLFVPPLASQSPSTSAKATADKRLRGFSAQGSDAERALEAELGESTESLRIRIEGERDRHIAEIVGCARQAAEKLDGVPPERIRALADLVLSRLLAAMGRP